MAQQRADLLVGQVGVPGEGRHRVVEERRVDRQHLVHLAPGLLEVPEAGERHGPEQRAPGLAGGVDEAGLGQGCRVVVDHDPFLGQQRVHVPRVQGVQPQGLPQQCHAPLPVAGVGDQGAGRGQEGRVERTGRSRVRRVLPGKVPLVPDEGDRAEHRVCVSAARIDGEGLTCQLLSRGQVGLRVRGHAVGGLDGTRAATHRQDDRRADARVHRSGERLVSSKQGRLVAFLDVGLEGQPRRILAGVHGR